MRERTRTLALVIAALAAVALAAPATSSAQAGGGSACPSTFEVLHDDTVGALYLPRGHYRITLLGSRAPSCAQASDLFRQFLEDWDGKLRRPWVVNSRASSFTKGRGGSGFSVTPAGSGGGGGGGGHYPSGSVCPGTYRIRHNDHIGTFRIPKGTYEITLLSVGRITCRQSSRYLTGFLSDYDGILPSPWFIDTETGSFMRGGRNTGFRIKKLAGPPRPSGGGSGVYPNGRRCPGTFDVLHNDSIGQLRLRKGPYIVTLVNREIPCTRVSQLFRGFLDDFEGNLPRPWRVNIKTGTFTRGGSSAPGFRVKPAR
jgi:hypothetical protein